MQGPSPNYTGFAESASVDRAPLTHDDNSPNVTASVYPDRTVAVLDGSQNHDLAISGHGLLVTAAGQMNALPVNGEFDRRQRTEFARTERLGVTGKAELGDLTEVEMWRGAARKAGLGEFQRELTWVAKQPNDTWVVKWREEKSERYQTVRGRRQERASTAA